MMDMSDEEVSVQEVLDSSMRSGASMDNQDSSIQTGASSSKYGSIVDAEEQPLLQDDPDSLLQDDPEEDPEDDHHHQYRWDLYSILGLLFAVLAGLAFTGANVVQKLFPKVNFWHLLFLRSIAQLIVMTPIVKKSGSSFLGPADVRWRIYAQGFLGGILLLCIFIAIKHIPIGSAAAIFFTAQAFTMMFSTCMVREHCGVFRIIVCVLILSGVGLVTKPMDWIPKPQPANHTANGSTVDPEADPDRARVITAALIGYFAALMVPVLSAIISILTRQCKHVNPFVLTFWFGIGGLASSLVGFQVVSMFTDSGSGQSFNHSPGEWGGIIGVIALGIMGNIIFTIAIRWVTASRAMVIRSFEPVLNYILQLKYFKTVSYSVLDPIGIALILVGMLIMNFEQRVMKYRRKKIRTLKWL